MNLPGTKTLLGNGTLGRIAATEDGTSGLIVSGIAVGGQFALGDVMGPFTQLADVEAKGITEAYDTTNLSMAWKHCRDFYIGAPAGTKLYLMVVVDTQTLTVTATEATTNGLKKLIDGALGNIRLVGLTWAPNISYTPTFSGQLEADLWTALAAGKITAENHRLAKSPYRMIFEGRNFQGTMSSLKDLRDSATTPGVNRAMVVIGNDYDYGAGAGIKSKYASVGLMLGRAAASKVNRNIGRVKSGVIEGIGTGGFSSGAKYSTFSEAHLDIANDFGYVFPRVHKRRSGLYWNDDHMACVETDDYAQLALGRVIDKVDVIVHEINTEEILDEISVDKDTGKMDIASVKHYQQILEDGINAQMGGNNAEISGVDVFVDPDQNVISTSKLVEVVKITPTATGRVIETTIEYNNPLVS